MRSNRPSGAVSNSFAPALPQHARKDGFICFGLDTVHQLPHTWRRACLQYTVRLACLQYIYCQACSTAYTMTFFVEQAGTPTNPIFID